MTHPTPPSHEEMVAHQHALIERMEQYLAAGGDEQVAQEVGMMRHILAQLEASRWRPIAEAPKDGTEIVVSGDDGDPWIARWYKYPPGSYADGGWQIKSPPGRDPIAYIKKPDWWMPLYGDDLKRLINHPKLPSPPATTSEGSEGA